MSDRIVVLAYDEDDAWDFYRRRKSDLGDNGVIVWPGLLHQLNNKGTFDRLKVTAKAIVLPDAYVTSILPRIRKRTLPSVGIDMPPGYEGLAAWAREQVGDWA